LHIRLADEPFMTVLHLYVPVPWGVQLWRLVCTVVDQEVRISEIQVRAEACQCMKEHQMSKDLFHALTDIVLSN